MKTFFLLAALALLALLADSQPYYNYNITQILTNIHPSYVAHLTGSTPAMMSICSTSAGTFSNIAFTTTQSIVYSSLVVVPRNNRMCVGITRRSSGVDVTFEQYCLLPGVYIITGFVDASNHNIALYSITYGHIRTFSASSTDVMSVYRINGTGYCVRFYTCNPASYGFCAIEEVMKFYDNFSNRAIILFNMSGTVPLAYNVTFTNSTTGTQVNARIFTYSGGPPTIGFFYVTLQGRTRVRLVGSSYLEIPSGGIYLVFNRSAWSLSQQQQQRVMRTLSVQTVPATYTIAFFTQQGKIAEGTGSLSRQFENGTSVTYKIFEQDNLRYENTIILDKDYTFIHNFAPFNATRMHQLTLYVVDYSTGRLLTADMVSIRGPVSHTFTNTNTVAVSVAEGTYEVEVAKAEYKTARMIVTVKSSTTLYVFMVKATDTPPPIIAPTNGTAPAPSTWQQITATTPTPPSAQEWYGLHFIVLDPATRNLATTPVIATVYALKSVNKVLWQDQVEVPLGAVEVRGQQHWYITKDSLDAMIKPALWESFNGFKIVALGREMYVPAAATYKQYAQVVIYTQHNVLTATVPEYRSGLFESMGNVAQLFFALLPLMIIATLLSALRKRH